MTGNVWRKKYICIILIAALFLSGMCFVCMEAEAVSFSAHQGELTSKVYSSDSFSQKEHVTSEELSGLAHISRGMGLERELREKLTGIILIFLLAASGIHNGFVRRFRRIKRKMIRSRDRIVYYIHQKDGSKAY